MGWTLNESFEHPDDLASIAAEFPGIGTTNSWCPKDLLRRSAAEALLIQNLECAWQSWEDLLGYVLLVLSGLDFAGGRGAWQSWEDLLGYVLLVLSGLDFAGGFPTRLG